MKNSKAIAALRKYTGPVYGCMMINNDVMYVQIVKSDLIASLKRKGLDEVTISLVIKEGVMYVDNCDEDDEDEIEYI